ncbi:MAG: transporter substrate-binding domain-containing protein [Bacilli bacterium]
MKTKTLIISLLLLSVLSSGCSETKKLKGFDIDLARKVGEKLNLDVEFVEIIWENKELELNAKTIDLIWNGMTITEERKENMEMSVPYMENGQVIISKTAFNSALSATSEYKIAYEQGSAGNDLADSDSLFQSCQKIEVSSQIDALTEVLSGTSDLAIIDSVMAGYYLTNSSYSSLKILSEYSFENEFYGIGGRKGDKALMAKINETLSALYSNESTLAIAQEYGLEDVLVAPTAYDSYDSITDKSSYETISEKGVLKIGYTVFAPIAFEG